MRRSTNVIGRLLAIAAILAFVWLASNQEQRRQYLTWLGKADQPPTYETTKFQSTSDPTSSLHLRYPAERLGLPPAIPVFQFHSVAHDAVGSPCIPEGVPNPTRASRDQIYRWIDQDGRTHFSDVPPERSKSEVIGYTAERGVGMFSAYYNFLGKKQPSEFQQSLQRNIAGVFRIFERQLRLKQVPPLHVNVTIIHGKQRFAR